MQFRINDEFPRIREFIAKDQQLVIQECIMRHPACASLAANFTPAKHFDHLWTTLMKAIKSNGKEAQKAFDMLFCLARFTPEYPREVLAKMTSDRLETLVGQLTSQTEHLDMCCHIYVQLLAGLDSSTAAELAQLVAEIGCENSTVQTVLHEICAFFVALNNDDGDVVTDLFPRINAYLTLRADADTPMELRKISAIIRPCEWTKLFSRVVKTLAKARRLIDPRNIVGLISQDVSFLYALSIDDDNVIPYRNLPPLSLLIQSKGLSVDINLIAMYRPIMLAILEAFAVLKDPNLSDATHLSIFRRMFDAVNSGPAGRDAFVMVCLYSLAGNTWRAQQLPNFGDFMSLIVRNTKSKITTLCTVAFVNAMGSECFEVKAVFVGFAKQYIVDLLQAIINNNPNSALQKKASHVKTLFVRDPTKQYSVVDEAALMTHSLYSKVEISDPVRIIKYCADRMYSYDYYVAFTTLTRAFSQKVAPNCMNVSFACSVVGKLICVFLNLPPWHMLNLLKEKMIAGVSQMFDDDALMVLLHNDLLPHEFLGGMMLIVHLVKEKPEKLTNWGRCWPEFAARLISKLASFEIKGAAMLLVEFFQCMPFIGNTAVRNLADVVLQSPVHGWRHFVRLFGAASQSKIILDAMTQSEILSTAFARMIEMDPNKDPMARRAVCHLWRAIGSFSKIGKFVDCILPLVEYSASMTFGEPEVQEYFYNMLLDLSFNCSHIVMSKLSLKCMNTESEAFDQFLRKLPQNAAKRFAGELYVQTGESEHRKRSPVMLWPVEDWINEVAGIGGSLNVC